MKTRYDFETRFKKEGDRPKGKPFALRFPVEIEDALLEGDNWKALLVETSGDKIASTMIG